MNKILQQIKIERKVELIIELVKSLVEYNNIEGYNNQKKFTIKLDYQKDMFEPLYFYKITVIRGINKPKNIFNLRFVSDENIKDLLSDITENFIENEYFSHTTFSTGINRKDYTSYNINLKNNVEFKLGIKSDEELKIFNEIEKRFKSKSIILESPKLSDKSKDEVQKEKFMKIIQLFKKIMNILEEYNSIEDYTNKKPFKLKISNIYNEKKRCYVYTYSIIRGDITPEVILSLRASINDKRIAYDNIYDLLVDFKIRDSFLIDSVKFDSDGEYCMYLKNGISIELIFDKEKDLKFYSAFMKETGKDSEEIIKNNTLKYSYKK